MQFTKKINKILIKHLLELKRYNGRLLQRLQVVAKATRVIV